MITPEEESDPIKPTGADWAHMAVRAGLSAVPFVGGPAVELLNTVIAPPVGKRRDQWLASVAAGLKELEHKVEGLRPESLRDNPAFISVMLQASQAALRAHQEEKLIALRNTVLNAAAGARIDEDLQAMFLNLIDVFTPWHLRVLNVLHNAEHVFPGSVRDDSLVRPFATRIGVVELVQRAYPHLGITSTSTTRSSI